ncbi:MAG: SRPBCC domain-containing protein [Flavobacteriales bacterium]|nr:SRPBCC domain-containing protein [Flavobacteriales bacterium]
MNRPEGFNFSVSKEGRTINVERFFNAPRAAVWAAWTEAEILCQWWAPKPYECVITGLDLRAGGRWSYYMKGPEGDRHYCFFDYTEVRPEHQYAGKDGSCDEAGNINLDMPRSRWENRFNDHDGGTMVSIVIRFDTAEDVENIVQMGFKEGFTMGLEQLDELLAASSR